MGWNWQIPLLLATKLNLPLLIIIQIVIILWEQKKKKICKGAPCPTPSTYQQEPSLSTISICHASRWGVRSTSSVYESFPVVPANRNRESRRFGFWNRWWSWITTVVMMQSSLLWERKSFSNWRLRRGRWRMRCLRIEERKMTTTTTIYQWSPRNEANNSLLKSEWYRAKLGTTDGWKKTLEFI